MNVELQINDSTDTRARFVGWSPSPCKIRVTDPSGATGSSSSIKLSMTSAATAGAVGFAATAAGPFAATLTLTVPHNGSTVPFFVAGVFNRPSSTHGDVNLQARRGTALVGSVRIMVRVRKNAARLSPAERDRLVSAFATLNNRGMGRFVDFRNMHTSVSSPQAHGAPGFLPWHRAYLLDLERELQAIDPSVSLPYWRFDQPAPSIFTRDFLGSSDSMGNVMFSATNPLQFWRTDGVTGITRRPFFTTTSAPPGLLTETQTLALGTTFAGFRNMENNPHGRAHTSFGGLISSIPTAARDPLFFLLHCNVDRLWAKWQHNLGRFDPAAAGSYDNSSSQIGHRLPDTMWPWNGVTGGSRPPTAPGGPMPASPAAAAPGGTPQVRQMVDFHGAVAAASRLGFDYDDVSFF